MLDETEGEIHRIGNPEIHTTLYRRHRTKTV